MRDRSTRILIRRVGEMLFRMEELEQHLRELQARLARLEASRETGQAAPPLPPPVPARQPPFARSELEPQEGARLVARHMLRTGTPAQKVAAHLEDTFDLPDADSVVEDVAHYDSRPSEPNQEGR